MALLRSGGRRRHQRCSCAGFAVALLSSAVLCGSALWQGAFVSLRSPSGVRRASGARVVRSAAGKDEGTPQYVETKKVNWSDDDYANLPEMEENEGNAILGASVVAGIVGLITGGFFEAIFFAFLGNGIAGGSLTTFLRQNKVDEQFVEYSVKLGDFSKGIGTQAVKFYNGVFSGFTRIK
eukprot:TRINITY_DN123544_c0_g1_i1.p1 TRINITY_DN123544_c0_g1~~TRINITY_DN123544_c0_g1_i1.p1  ORF type:complete len:180 (-),score=34.67 TRINITY_DN123544_c0_g1_i1:124-663(-)